MTVALRMRTGGLDRRRYVDGYWGRSMLSVSVNRSAAGVGCCAGAAAGVGGAATGPAPAGAQAASAPAVQRSHRLDDIVASKVFGVELRGEERPLSECSYHDPACGSGTGALPAD
jgi:hypothetical protein